MTISTSEPFIKTHEVVRALGSNLGDRIGYLERALKLITKNPKVRFLGVASFYETLPQGSTQEQGNYINTAIALKTELTPEALLKMLLEIEIVLGRKREELNGPRTIDLDIILYEDTSTTTQDLTLPHPRFRDRAFVLLPLRDLLKQSSCLKSDYWKPYRKEYETYHDPNGIVQELEPSSLFRKFRNFS